MKRDDTVRFIRTEEMLWSGGKWIDTNYSLGCLKKVLQIFEDKIKLDNEEWYNIDGLEVVGKVTEFQVGDEVEFLRIDEMLWCNGLWHETGSYGIGDRNTIKAVREGQVQLGNDEWYNPDGLKLISRGDSKMAKCDIELNVDIDVDIKFKEEEKEMKAIVSNVFKKESLETAEIIDKYMYEEDLGKGFMAELVLSKKENKDAVIVEARKRQADEISAVKSVK